MAGMQEPEAPLQVDLRHGKIDEAGEVQPHTTETHQFLDRNGQDNADIGAFGGS
jgi:hypothetical protein